MKLFSNQINGSLGLTKMAQSEVPVPLEKIYWKKIPQNAVVQLKGNEYFYNNTLVYWDNATAIDAQLFLKSRLK